MGTKFCLVQICEDSWSIYWKATQWQGWEQKLQHSSPYIRCSNWVSFISLSITQVKGIFMTLNNEKNQLITATWMAS